MSQDIQKIIISRLDSIENKLDSKIDGIHLETGNIRQDIHKLELKVEKILGKVAGVSIVVSGIISVIFLTLEIYGIMR